ncbi:MAG: hypothetical protein JOY79_03495 [Acidobacteriaceae bacterium]|nr:hypothetical protein [Acidobacteriaceae bacterium]
MKMKDQQGRRGRPFRTAGSGFGAFLEAAMRYQHAIDARGQGFTDYLAGLYASARPPGVSLRHLMRLRGAHDTPSFGTLRRIAENFPSVGDFDEGQSVERRFKDELWAPRLGWGAVRETWKLLRPGSDVSICMGLLPVWALERLTGPIVNDIGAAIADPKRELRFNFVFPQAPRTAAFWATGSDRELSPDETLEDLRLSITKAMLRAGGNNLLVRSRIQARVRGFETKVSPEAMYFWSRSPRALMVSNLFDPNARAGDEFAAAYEVNQVPYPASFMQRFDPPLPPPLTAAGWGYLMPQSHERLRWLFNWLLESGQVMDESGRRVKRIKRKK